MQKGKQERDLQLIDKWLKMGMSEESINKLLN
jgi:hypothetical protein